MIFFFNNVFAILSMAYGDALSPKLANEMKYRWCVLVECNVATCTQARTYSVFDIYFGYWHH